MIRISGLQVLFRVFLIELTYRTHQTLLRLSQDKTPGYGIKAYRKDHDGQIWAATSGRGLAHYLPDQDSFEFFIPNPLKPHDGSTIMQSCFRNCYRSI
jgi:hypothetical protein